MSIDRVKRIITVEPRKTILYATVVFAIAYLYYPTFSWMANHWESTSHYSHGPLVPMITFFLLWIKRQRLRELPKSSSGWGLVIVVGSLLLLWLAVKGDVNRVSALTFIVLLYGLCLYFYGKKVFKELLFPIGFLLFMVPLTFLDSMLGLPLRLLVTKISTGILAVLGIATQRVGTYVYTTDFHFDVASPCSGIRSLIALMAIGSVFAYLTQKSLLKKVFLFLFTIPIAVLSNIVRITTVGLVARGFGQKFAVGIYHDFSGFLVYGAALFLLVLVSKFINFDLRRLLAQWKKQSI